MLKGVCFQEIKIDKMESNIFRSIWGCHGYSWGGFVNVRKRELEEVNRDILAGLLAKECLRWLIERVPGCLTQMTIVLGVLHGTDGSS